MTPRRSPPPLLIIVVAVVLGVGCTDSTDRDRSSAPAASVGASRRSLPPPLIHHVGLNVVDAAVSMAWYQMVWPEGTASSIDGAPALRSTVRGTDPPHDFFHVFRGVGEPADGRWDPARYRSIPQSPFWHIGTYENTTGLESRFDALGITMIPMWPAPGGAPIWRSGESPFRGMQTGERIAAMSPERAREGGFGYIVGPDGELVEVSGGPQSRRGFDHVHFFHEQPWCAARWYIEHLGMRPPGRRNPATGELVELSIPEPCEVALAAPTYPSLEPQGTLRGPRATVRYGNGAMSSYPRQCRDGRCDEDQRLVSSAGHVLDHVGFLIPDLERHVERLREEGVRIIQEIHAFDDTRAAMIADLDGLLLHLVETAED